MSMDSLSKLLRGVFVVVCFGAALPGCSSSGNSGAGSVPTPNPVTIPIAVTISPASANVTAGSGTQTFTASVTNTTNSAVTWTVNSVAGGNSTVGTISAAGVYAAPVAVPSPASVTVAAVSAADTTKSATASVTIAAAPPPPPPTVTIAVSPATVSLQAGSGTQTFIATVTNSTNTGVTWKVNTVTGGNTTFGTISAAGLYTAPASVPSPAVVTVTAVSAADPNKSATATVTITAAPPVTVAGAPALMFTDLVSGPSTGNSDNSQTGQTAGQDGAIVTVWGKNLGTSGSISVGGVSARIYSWGNATAPANLLVRHGMQMIAFQIPHQLSNGPTTIQATVGGVVSNNLPFTVRSGAIYFVKTNGNDATGDGSWSKPWAKVSKATAALEVGAIVYLGDGVWQNAPDGDRSTLNLDTDPGKLATAAMPKALIAYPGATAKIGTDSLDAWSTFVSGSPSPSTYWIISKLVLAGKDNAATYNTGFRLIGNHVSTPQGNGQTGAIGGIDSGNLYVLGNELTNCGYAGTSKLYHPMYIQSPESSTAPRLPNSDNREIAWNYLHDQ